MITNIYFLMKVNSMNCVDICKQINFCFFHFPENRHAKNENVSEKKKKKKKKNVGDRKIFRIRKR
jgi:hypothetical protein